MKFLSHIVWIAVFCWPFSTKAQPADIDSYPKCIYTQTDFSDPIYFFGENPKVEQIINEICLAAGVPKNFIVASANVPGVAVLKGDTSNYILYSPSYVRRLLNKNPDLLYLVLAHEIGHLVRNHKLDGKYRLKEESSADEFMGRALYQLKNYGSLSKVLLNCKQEEFAYGTLYGQGARDNTISNGWKAMDGLVKSNDNLGYLENEGNLGKLPLPLFKVKGCPRYHNFPIGNFNDCEKVEDVDEMLTQMLDDLGYEQRSYFYVSNGFALLTPIEQIDENGAALSGQERWQDYPSMSDFDGFLDYLSSLVLPRKGYFRLFVFLVTDDNVEHQNEEISSNDARAWLKEGGFWLPPSIGEKPLNDHHKFSVLIYEFEAPETTKKMTETCDGLLLSIKQHLHKSGIENKINK